MAQLRETSKHREVFEAWYAAERSFRKVTESTGIKKSTLYDWADRWDWHDRADERDKIASQLADQEAAKQRAERQKARRDAGTLLVQKGVDYFNVNGVDSPGSAIQAIKA
ncbi:hypothetical protein EON80_30440, partial [bacterium]